MAQLKPEKAPPGLDTLQSHPRVVQRITIHENGCWVWNGETNRNGYGRVHFNQKKRVVHRVVWFLFYGELPADTVLDHLCRNRLCCNPSHLEPVSVFENTIRGQAVLFKKREQN